MADGGDTVDVKVEDDDWEVMSEPEAEVEEGSSKTTRSETKTKTSWKNMRVNLESGQRHMLDVNLIEAVKKYPFMYDPMHPQNRDTFLKEKTWRQIGQAISVNPDYCKLRWKSIRDRFVKTEKQERMMKAKGLKLMSKPYRFAASLSFLKDYLRVKSNAQGYQNASVDDDDVVTQDSQSDKDNADDSSVSDYGWTPQNMASPNTKQHTSGSDRQLSVNVEPPHGPLLNNGMSQAMPSVRRQRIPESPNDHVVHYYDIPSPSDSRFHAGNHSSMPPSLTPGRPPALTGERDLSFEGDSGYDEVTYFLMSLAPSLRRLSPEKQSLAKIKMQTLLHEIEFNK